MLRSTTSVFHLTGPPLACLLGNLSQVGRHAGKAVSVGVSAEDREASFGHGEAEMDGPDFLGGKPAADEGVRGGDNRLDLGGGWVARRGRLDASGHGAQGRASGGAVSLRPAGALKCHQPRQRPTPLRVRQSQNLTHWSVSRAG